MVEHQKASYEIPSKDLGGSHFWKDKERNQGDIGSCTAFAVAHCLEYKYGTHMSASMLYLLAKQEFQDTKVHGFVLEDMMKYATKEGTYREEVLDDANFLKHVKGENMGRRDKKLDPEYDLKNLINEERKKHFPNRYTFVRYTSLGKNPDAIIHALKTNKKPIAMADLTHAVACYGYENKEFLCKNSWGPQGKYYRIRFQDVQEAYSWE